MGGGLGVEQWGIKNLGGAADDLEYLVNAIAFNLHFVSRGRGRFLARHCKKPPNLQTLLDVILTMILFFTYLSCLCVYGHTITNK